MAWSSVRPSAGPSSVVMPGQFERAVERAVAAAGMGCVVRDGLTGLRPLVDAPRHRDRRRNPRRRRSDPTQHQIISPRLRPKSQPARPRQHPKSEFSEPGVVVIPPGGMIPVSSIVGP